LTVITVLITRQRVIILNKRLDVQEQAENEARIENGQEVKPKGWRYPL
jgi:hypothetical protein